MPIRNLLIALLGVVCSSLSAQEETLDITQLLENYFQDQATLDPDAVQWLPDHLEALLINPIPINEADQNSLQAMGLIGPIKIEQLLNYRQKLGPLLSIFELQAVPGWSVEDIRLIKPFIRFESASLDRRARPLYAGFYSGTNELLYRFYRAKTQPNMTAQEGSPVGIGLRYRHQFDGRMRIGFTMEKDPGEALFQKSNPHGFDFYSFHLFVEEKSHKWLKKLAVGDFSVQMGQGLLLQTGYSPGKSAASVQLLRPSRGISPYSGFGEALFLRGAGAYVQLNEKLGLQIFASRKKRDASLDTLDSTDPESSFFTSLQTAGLHRTAIEIANEGKVQETIIGTTISQNFQDGLLSLNILYNHFNANRGAAFLPYRLHQFRGKQLLSGSLDYQFRRNNVLFFGENAFSQNGGTAFANGVILGLDRSARLALLFRELAPHFQTIYGAAFAESTGSANERGCYLGVEIRPLKSLLVNGFVDIWQHPWLRYQVAAPSRGSEYLIKCSWQPTKQFQTYILGQSRSKMQNAPYPIWGLTTIVRARLRLHLIYKVNAGMEYRCRIEWMRLTTEGSQEENGFLAYQELVLKPKRLPLSGTIRYAIFDTDSYSSRVYAFENALFSAVSIPALAGRGTRFYANIRWKASSMWHFDARIEATYLERSVNPGSNIGFQPLLQVQGKLRW